MLLAGAFGDGLGIWGSEIKGQGNVVMGQMRAAVSNVQSLDEPWFSEYSAIQNAWNDWLSSTFSTDTEGERIVAQAQDFISRYAAATGQKAPPVLPTAGDAAAKTPGFFDTLAKTAGSVETTTLVIGLVGGLAVLYFMFGRGK